MADLLRQFFFMVCIQAHRGSGAADIHVKGIAGIEVSLRAVDMDNRFLNGDSDVVS